MTDWSKNPYQTREQNEICELRDVLFDLLDALELARSWVATRLGDTHEDLQKIDAAIARAKGSTT